MFSLFDQELQAQRKQALADFMAFAAHMKLECPSEWFAQKVMFAAAVVGVLVLRSPWAALLGFPIALIGAAYVHADKLRAKWQIWQRR